MIHHEISGTVWTLRIDRQDKANSLTRAMLGEIAAKARAAGEAGVAALVLTGSGKVFSAGADLDEARAGLATDPIWEEVSGAIAALPCLTVAALNGTLAGGAFGMALACDVRIGVPGAKFFYPVMKLGFLPQPSDPGRLRALIGPANTKMLLMGGTKIDADTALRWGLLQGLAAPEDLAAAVGELTAVAEGAKPEISHKIKLLIDSATE